MPSSHGAVDTGGLNLRDGGPVSDQAQIPAPDMGPAADLGDSGQTSPTVWLEVCGVSSHLNMREGPGTSYNVILELPSGARVRLIGESGAWRQVDYQGTEGWAHETYLCPVAGSSDGGNPPADSGSTGSPGASIGELWNTFYYLAVESDFSGAKDTVLYDAQCQPVATVSASYSDAVCIEGSGRLASGETINYAKTCSCGRPCPTGGTICYKVLAATKPWGEGAFSNPLEPLRSIAVDKDQIPLGSTLYLKQLDGLPMPSLDGIGGFVHDGCVRADDVGGAIKGMHIDIFAGSKAMWQALEALLPTKSKIAAFQGGPRCSYLE